MLIRDAEREIDFLDSRYKQLENLIEKNQGQNHLLFQSLDEADSLQRLAFKDLSRANDSLDNKLTEVRDSLNSSIIKLQQDLYEARKGNASLLIILFSLLVISFIYLYYKNYRVEVQLNDSFLKLSLETERKIAKLKNNLRKKLSSTAESIDKKVKKRFRKSDNSLEKKMRKLK